MVDIKQFELIKKELEKYPLKTQYIYLLQLQKYIEKTTKNPAVLKEIDRLLKEIEGKFSNDSSWKRDILTTLMSKNNDDNFERPRIDKHQDIEQIIQQTQEQIQRQIQQQQLEQQIQEQQRQLEQQLQLLQQQSLPPTSTGGSILDAAGNILKQFLRR